MSDGYQNLQHSEFCCKARQVRLLTNMGLFVYPVLPPLYSSLLPPLGTFLLPLPSLPLFLVDLPMDEGDTEIRIFLILTPLNSNLGCIRIWERWGVYAMSVV